MKSTAINSSMKRKKNTSLLKIANIKKRRTHQKTITSYDYVFKEAETTQAEFPENVLCPVNQLTKTRTAQEKPINQQHKQALQQLDMISFDRNQCVINYCDCLLCRNNYQWKNQVQTLNQRKNLHKQKTRSIVSRFNFKMKQAKLTTADNFKVFLKTQGVEQRAVCERKFNQQNLFYKHYFVANQNACGSTSQSSWSDFDQKQSNIPKLNDNFHFKNKYVPCYDQKQTFQFFDKFSTFQQASDSMTSSTESIDSDTNDVMTSQKFEDYSMTSQQFQMSNNLNFWNFVY